MTMRIWKLTSPEIKLLVLKGVAKQRNSEEMSSKEKEETIQKLLKLYKDPNFSGSFSSFSIFKNALISEKNIKVPNSYIFEMYKRIPQFIAQKRRTKPKLYRTYMVHDGGKFHFHCSS